MKCICISFNNVSIFHVCSYFSKVFVLFEATSTVLCLQIYPHVLAVKQFFEQLSLLHSSYHSYFTNGSWMALMLAKRTQNNYLCHSIESIFVYQRSSGLCSGLLHHRQRLSSRGQKMEEEGRGS